MRVVFLLFLLLRVVASADDAATRYWEEDLALYSAEIRDAAFEPRVPMDVQTQEAYEELARYAEQLRDRILTYN
jgi:hypothetical protein